MELRTEYGSSEKDTPAPKVSFESSKIENSLSPGLSKM